MISGEIERRDQAEQIAERLRTELADRVGHRAERADRRRLHDDRDDTEHRVGGIVDERADRVATLAERHQREAEQHGEEEDLQDLTLCERADDGVGNDVQDEIDRLHLGRLLRVARDGRRVALAGEADARLQNVADQKA